MINQPNTRANWINPSPNRCSAKTRDTGLTGNQFSLSSLLRPRLCQVTLSSLAIEWLWQMQAKTNAFVLPTSSKSKPGSTNSKASPTANSSRLGMKNTKENKHNPTTKVTKMKKQTLRIASIPADSTQSRPYYTTPIESTQVKTTWRFHNLLMHLFSWFPRLELQKGKHLVMCSWDEKCGGNELRKDKMEQNCLSINSLFLR